VPTAPHNRLLAEAARAVLKPLGLQQKGRSRTWLDDQGWWIGVVEFQPSSWSKGTYLNVGVTWPWHPDDDPFLYFDVSSRIEGFVQYASTEQFEPEAYRLAHRAADEIRTLRDRLSDFGTAARLLTEECRLYSGWACWDGAVASILAGDSRGALDMFAAVEASDDERDWWQPVKRQASAWARLLQDDERELRSEVRALMTRNRAAFGLPPDHPALPE
jgi:hypothetical protein